MFFDIEFGDSISLKSRLIETLNSTAFDGITVSLVNNDIANITFMQQLKLSNPST